MIPSVTHYLWKFKMTGSWPEIINFLNIIFLLNAQGLGKQLEIGIFPNCRTNLLPEIYLEANDYITFI